MKLARFGPLGSERPAVVDGETLIDVSSLVTDYDNEFWTNGQVEYIRTTLSEGRINLPRLPVNTVRLGAPISRPQKIICIGMNYRGHAVESGSGIPEEPVLFMKAPNTVIGPFDDVLIPPDSKKTDWEIELAVVMGARARYLPSPQAAAGAIGGYAISNDISERENQLERGGQWVKGKSAESFNPLGPYVVTPDEVDDPDNLDLTLLVNGVTRQHSNTRDCIFDPTYLVWYISQFMVLEPGDLINTGTPAGVGLGMKPPQFLDSGDVMELSISGLGRQRQVCKRAHIDG
jgi:2-keto-4-pentenoate hydratase/2-oxohepta-3-ene-1,7-dioic acid hydratase in catechol pathway